MTALNVKDDPSDLDAHAPLAGMFDAKRLMTRRFAPIKYIVPSLIPEGLTLLVAAPKIGKSWMVLGLGLACAVGGQAFGAIDVEQRPVLYLALEDGPRRLQSRLRSIGCNEASGDLNFMVQIPNGDFLAAVAEFLNVHSNRSPLVILDTLGKVQRSTVGNESAYERDYRTISSLKRLADQTPGSAVIVVHHTRKAESDDFIDSISGTQGIAGAADTILVLKRDRRKASARLQVTSRDAHEGEYSLNLSERGVWTLEGGSLDQSARVAHTLGASEGLGDKMTELIRTIGNYPDGITPAGLKSFLSHWKAPDIDTYLRRAVQAGRIQRLGRGKYASLAGPATPM